MGSMIAPLRLAAFRKIGPQTFLYSRAPDVSSQAGLLP